MADRSTYKINLDFLERFRGSGVVEREGFSKSGVFHSFLFGYLGRGEALGYVHTLMKELGPEGMAKLIEEAVELVPPPPPEPPKPEQLTIPETQKPDFDRHLDALGFVKTVNKDHPGVTVASAWKLTHKMRFVTFDQLKDRVGPSSMVFSAKLDGELVSVNFQDNKTEVVTNKGTIRSNMPATEEVTKALSGKYKQATFMGELYVVDDAGKPQSYLRGSKILKNPDSGYDHLIKLAIFDVVKVDDKDYSEHTLSDKVAFIKKLFSGAEHVHSVEIMEGDIDDMEALWNELDKRGFEGLVIHLPDGSILKSKPILSFDMVIVALAKSTSIPGRIGAILASFIDKDGRYRLNGHIGTGLTDEQRLEFMEFARKYSIKEDAEYIWVDPTKSPVIEVEAVEVNPKKRPSLEFRDGVYVEVEKQMSGVLRFPTLKFTRPDKDPKYPDVTVEQLPFEVESSRFKVGMRIRTVAGQIGTIRELASETEDPESNYGLIVHWDVPVWNIAFAKVRPSEVVGIIPR